MSLSNTKHKQYIIVYTGSGSYILLYISLIN